MANYIDINQHNRGGELAISRKVFARLATETLNQSSLKSEAKVTKPVEVVFKKDGRVKIKIAIEIKKGIKPTTISLEIQKEVARALETYCESVPFEIEIDVDKIK